ncbi:hypothetical protein [Vibrio navarrensis]|uniref:hypothetical protein n=1 Tax=Vibrio navarrensis TaxID=29495 RepID=UPI00186AAEF1|nr:hypothetical protein [Vibrio navarrensis]MBE4590610.1 hypothetical protein [Vibrio navarrensis]
MDYSEFKEHFSILSDTRQARKSTYNFFEVMFQVVTAMLCQGSRMLLTHLFIEFWDKIFRNRLN